MQCQRCGYVLDAFATDCPICVGVNAQIATVDDEAALEPIPISAEAAPISQPIPEPASPCIPPVRRVSDDRESNPLKRAANFLRELLGDWFGINVDAPALGKPLTYTLLVLLVINSYYLLKLVIAIVLALLDIGLDASVNGAIFLVMLFWTMRVASLVALLRCQRWGLYTFLIFVAMPAVFILMFSSPPYDWFEIGFSILQGILVVLLVLMKWDELD